MSPERTGKVIVTYSFPRVSGDEPHASDPAYGMALFSPRERG